MLNKNSLKKKIFIIGSSGLLGNQLYHYIKKKHIVYNNGLKKRKFNLLKYNKIEKYINKIQPNLIINCSAITNIDYCNKNKKHAYQVNVLVVKNIFNILKKNKIKCKIIQISTDQFYNNKNYIKNVESKKNYLNYYTNTKLMVEKECMKNKSIVIRTNFFGKSNSKKKSFTDWIYKSFKSKKNFYLFEDVFFSPLSIKTLCKMINLVVEKYDSVTGIYNIGSRKRMSKKEFAVFFAKKCGIYKNNFKAVKSSKFFKIRRPQFMQMNINKFEKKFKIKLPNLKKEITFESKNYL